MKSEERRKVLRLINLKEKRGGTIKGRTCVDGRPQQSYISKDEAVSPTCSNGAVLLTLVIAAYEKRKIATCDIAGVYLHAKMDEFIVIKL